MKNMMKGKMPSVGVEGHWSADKFSDNVLRGSTGNSC